MHCFRTASAGRLRTVRCPSNPVAPAPAGPRSHWHQADRCAHLLPHCVRLLPGVPQPRLHVRQLGLQLRLHIRKSAAVSNLDMASHLALALNHQSLCANQLLADPHSDAFPAPKGTGRSASCPTAQRGDCGSPCALPPFAAGLTWALRTRAISLSRTSRLICVSVFSEKISDWKATCTAEQTHVQQPWPMQRHYTGPGCLAEDKFTIASVGLLV